MKTLELSEQDVTSLCQVSTLLHIQRKLTNPSQTQVSDLKKFVSSQKYVETVIVSGKIQELKASGC